MHTFDVYRLYCCLLFVIFGLLAMNWFADGTKSKQSVILLCAFRFASERVATFGMYTSLKASAAMGKLWSSCCLLLRDVSLSSLVTATAPRHRTNDASSSTQLPRRTSILYSLVCCSFCWPRGWFWFVRTALSDGICFGSCADACPGEAWICLSCVHNLEPKRRAALRFPSFWVQNFALFQPNDNFPSSIFLILNRFSPPTERCFAYLRMLRLVVSELLFFVASK